MSQTQGSEEYFHPEDGRK